MTWETSANGFSGVRVSVVDTLVIVDVAGFTFAGWFTTGDPRVARLHTVDCLRAMMLPWTSVIVRAFNAAATADDRVCDSLTLATVKAHYDCARCMLHPLPDFLMEIDCPSARLLKRTCHNTTFLLRT